jgi:hypothetical protein
MDILAAVVVYLLSMIIQNWPTTWQTKVLLLVILLVLVICGFFGMSMYGHPITPLKSR